jgi:hypothetical protein
MIKYYYYKFPNKELVPKVWPDRVEVYEVGTLFNKDGVYDEYGRKIAYPTPKNGWFVNICCQSDVDLSFISQYEIKVTTPNCIWYGQDINIT